MHSVIAHYQEIALKGKNRPWFLRRLVHNVEAALRYKGKLAGTDIAGAVAYCHSSGSNTAGNSSCFDATYDSVNQLNGSISVKLPIGLGGAGKRNAQTSEELQSNERGTRAPIVGAVSMDLTTIDVTDIPDVKVGDQVVVMGEQRGPLGSDTVTANEIAALQGTIPWEVLTQVSRRVPRFYRDG